MFEDGLDRNPPRAARVYALIAASFFDAFIGSQDGKFTYWYIGPSQLNPAIVPLFQFRISKLSFEPLNLFGHPLREILVTFFLSTQISLGSWEGGW